ALVDMVDRARQRAPHATFLVGDVTNADVGEGYDRVVLAFVLHSFDAAGRITLMRRCAEVLTEDGKVGILDWARPRRSRTAALWGRVLSRIEPHPTGTQEILDGVLPAELAAAGFRLTHHSTTRSRQAQVLCAEHVRSSCPPPLGGRQSPESQR
ncbi:MAG: trans-aconitate 2-methyltransferase, partial [Solirubrobacteraceae bacterium]